MYNCTFHFIACDDVYTCETIAFETSSPRLRRTTIEIQLPDGDTPFTTGDQENDSWNQPQLSTAASVSAPEVNQVCH